MFRIFPILTLVAMALVIGAASAPAGEATEGHPRWSSGFSLRSEAQQPEKQSKGWTPTRGGAPTAWRGDATLRAVERLGRSHAWAVGDHGVVLRTDDGGLHWTACPLEEDVTLRAACFLTSQIGFVAGGKATPLASPEIGVIFRTSDGGEHWTKINESPIPTVQAIRFFSKKLGIAAGAASTIAPSGVFHTTDGGKTWAPLELGGITFSPDWHDAVFTSRGAGMAVGYRGRRAVIGENQLLPSRANSPGTQNLHAVAAGGGLSGWAVGDGGLVLATNDGGLVWRPQGQSLPPLVQNTFDFQAVAVSGEEVWIAGNPGSIVWHSDDDGRIWQAQATGTTLPIRDLEFQGRSGIAVGALGLILRTGDGGQTWQTIRGADRRAAMMLISSKPSRIPLPLIATLAGERGYRLVTILTVRHDLAVGGTERPALARRTHAAVAAAGGEAVLTGWTLPTTIPGIEEDKEALLRDWNRRTEGRLTEVLVGRLVTAIRTWRPAVLVIDVGEQETACGKLVRQATIVAARQASDATRYVGSIPSLPAWQVKKLYIRDDDGRQRVASIDATAPLSRLGVSVQDLCNQAEVYLGPMQPAPESPLLYRRESFHAGPNRIKGIPFFAGLGIGNGSPTRRPLIPLSTGGNASKRLARARLVRGLTEQVFADKALSAGMLAQIDKLSAGLSQDQAARQLLRLGQAQQRRHRWNLAEEMYVEIVRRYPDSPASRQAALWLLQLWTGAEPMYRRLQHLGVTKAETIPTLENATEAPEVRRASGTIAAGRGSTYKAELVRGWRRRAVQMLGILEKHAPGLFATPDVQSSLKLLRRTAGDPLQVELRKLVREAGPHLPALVIHSKNDDASLADPPTRQVVPCHTAQQPPRLDAEFSDPCWQDATAMTPRGAAGGAMPEGGLVMMTHDERFLYLAASLTRVVGRAHPTAQTGGRKHDEVSEEFDRLIIRLDCDRDQVTSYRFTIDERGKTAEACWHDPTWDPHWFVAVAGNGERWRIECAIPLAELTPRPPRPGQIWGVSIGRIVPAVGAQGWPGASVVSDPTGDPGGIRFE